jgi:hypothetical protein
VDLVFCPEFCTDVFWRRADCFCQDAGVPERTVFHFRNQIRSPAFGWLLLVGLASVFVRCGFGVVFAFVEAMKRPKKSSGAKKSQNIRADLSEIQRKLKFKFPARHGQAILDARDPIHEACDFLGLSRSKGDDILQTNECIHGAKFGDPWPDFLIAFASNGCGDYFAYDTRQYPASVIYIDPDCTVKENLQAVDKVSYETFEQWYESAIKPHTCRRCQSREARFKASKNRRFLLRVCPKCGFEEPAGCGLVLDR